MIPSRILVLGSGGREHALAWRLSQDEHRPEVLLGPGSPGSGARFERLDLHETDPGAVVRAALERRVGLVVVGPESVLAAGVPDALVSAGVPVFGASRAAARLESSKWFAKEVMASANVPTARAEVFGDVAGARASLGRFGPPWVIKADGLAAGKGVLVTGDRAVAEAFVSACLEGGRFGDGGRQVVLEEFLPGEEASVIAICDGERFVLLPAARDYKRAGDGDSGANTGGMGAYAPTPFVDAAAERFVGERVVAPVLREMAARGVPYRGALYCGLMLGGDGPRVVEFNARLGDPETQSILPLVGGSLTSLLESAARGELDAGSTWRVAGAAVTVALVDEGYPERVRGGGRITGLQEIETTEGVHVFHAGTCPDGGAWQVTGGRAAYVTALARNVEDARARAYAALGRLGGTGWRTRADIALPAARVEGASHA